MTQDDARTYVLTEARRRGIAAEIVAETGRELTARAHSHRIEQLTQAVRGGVGVRVIVGGRVGYGYTEELSREALDWMLQEAVENAGLQSETTGFLPTGTATPRAEMVGDRLQASLETKLQTALGFEGTLREDKRVKQVLIAAYAEREWDVAVASTEGADGSYRRGVAGLMASMVMQDGTSLKQGWDDIWATGVKDLDPGRTALEFTERTGRLLNARRLATGRYRAYFEPKAFAALLAAFTPMWNGKTVAEKKSPLAGRLGEAIAPPLVTIVDDPTLPDGLASRPVDAEGTPAKRTVLVDGGVLRSYLTNSETAKQLGVENTGHAWRGYRGTLGAGPSNIFLAPGPGLDLQAGVVIAELSGLHAGTNAITGEFSIQALGLWIEEGAVAYPVEDFAVAGNFLTLLQNITAVGDRLEWDFGMRVAYGTPMVEVRELSFAGA
ncbi:MAG TPA: metallopeptidase TldD-related protein [bacterium]|nr:metallopeptidase TldD-related protein [bacterium]